MNQNLTIPLVHLPKLPNESYCTPITETIFSTFSVLCGGMMGYIGGAVAGFLAFDMEPNDPHLGKLAFTSSIIAAIAALKLPYDWHQGCIEQTKIDDDLSTFAANELGLNKTVVKCYATSERCYMTEKVSAKSISLDGNLAYRTTHPQLPPLRKEEERPQKPKLQLIPKM